MISVVARYYHSWREAVMVWSHASRAVERWTHSCLARVSRWLKCWYCDSDVLEGQPCKMPQVALVPTKPCLKITRCLSLPAHLRALEFHHQPYTLTYTNVQHTTLTISVHHAQSIRGRPKRNEPPVWHLACAILRELDLIDGQSKTLFHSAKRSIVPLFHRDYWASTSISLKQGPGYWREELC